MSQTFPEPDESSSDQNPVTKRRTRQGSSARSAWPVGPINDQPLAQESASVPENLSPFDNAEPIISAETQVGQAVDGDTETMRIVKAPDVRPTNVESVPESVEENVSAGIDPYAQPGYAQAAMSTPVWANWQAQLSRQAELRQRDILRWFYAAGSQIFGLLTLISVILCLDFILLGFTDRETLIASLAIAIALPFNLLGLWLSFYLKERDRQTLFPQKQEQIDLTAFLALTVGAIFTAIALGTALWRISWVVTLVLLLATTFGLYLVQRVLSKDV